MIIRKLKNRHTNNRILAHLNINSLRYKIIDLTEILSYSEIDFLSVSETKIDDSFPDAQFQIDSYISFRRDRNQNGGGIFTLVKKGLLPNRKYEFESSVIEIISIEIVIKKTKWIIHAVYRPPSFDLALFFNELSNILDRTFGKYENLLILGDLNIDLSDQTKIPKSKKEFLHELCDAYDLHNLISEPTCITKTSESMIDLILTNCSRSFMHSKTVESGLSDFHKMTITTMKCTYTRQKPVKIT